jgi:hypothetical protein
VVKIKTESMDKLQEIVTDRLLRSKEVSSCTTMMIVPEKPKVVVLTKEVPKIFA